MSGIRSLYRGATQKGYASAASVPIRVDPTSNKIILIPAGSGTTEVSLADGSSGLAVTSPTGSVGFATGAGGTITQITSRTTGVTVNKPSGTIQTDVTSLAAETAAEFVVTNSQVAIGDVVVTAQQSGSNGGDTDVYVSGVAAGSFKIKVANNNAAAGVAETGAIIINFAVIKAVSA